MKCKKCGGTLERFTVEVEDSNLGSEGFECKKCGELLFDKKKSEAVVEDLRKKLLKDILNQP